MKLYKEHDSNVHSFMILCYTVEPSPLLPNHSTTYIKFPLPELFYTTVLRPERFHFNLTKPLNTLNGDQLIICVEYYFQIDKPLIHKKNFRKLCPARVHGIRSCQGYSLI